MILVWVSLTMLILSLLGIAFLYIRKFPYAAAADVKHLPAPAVRKAEIVETRLRRKFTGLWEKLSSQGRPMVGQVGTFFTKTQTKLRDLEHEYRARSIPVLLSRFQRQRLNEDIQTRLDQAMAYLADGEDKAAEEKCLQIVRLEPRSVPTFSLLGDAYFRRKEFSHAKEVFQFLIKLTEEDDAIYDHHSEEANIEARAQRNEFRIKVYERLTASYVGLEDLAGAFESIQQAHRLAPTNPKVLDTFITVAIAHGKRQFAHAALEQLRTVNPQNTNIPEWEQAIASLAETR